MYEDLENIGNNGKENRISFCGAENRDKGLLGILPPN